MRCATFLLVVGFGAGALAQVAPIPPPSAGGGQGGGRVARAKGEPPGGARLPIIAPRTDWTTDFTLGVDATPRGDHLGQMTIRVKGSTFPIVSYFSFPGIPQGGWNRLPRSGPSEADWSIRVQAVQPGRAYTVSAQGRFYSIRRDIRKKDDRVEVTDLVRNTGDADVGIMMKNYARFPRNSVSPERIFLGGVALSHSDFKVNDHLFVNTLPANPTFFATDGTNGIGLIADDNVYRTHAKEKMEVGLQVEGGIADDDFMLRAGESYTRTWAIYPVVGADYFDFINRVRRDLGANFTIDGPSITFNLQNLENARFLALQMGKYVDFWHGDLRGYFSQTGARYSITIEPLTPDHRQAYGSAFVKELTPAEDDQIARAVRRVHEAAPGVKVLCYCNRWLTTETGALTNYPDSTLVIDEKGAIYRGELKNATTKEAYPLAGKRNDPGLSYTAQVFAFVDKALALGFDGIYFDLFEELVVYDRPHPLTFHHVFDYAHADGHSAEIDPISHAIRHVKADITLTSLPTQLELIRRVTSAGKAIIANGAPLTKETTAIPFPRFTEIIPDPKWMYGADYAQGIAQNHLTSPIAYSYDKSDSIAASLRKYLAYGGLAYYSFLPFVFEPNPMQKLFPITPMELHRGYIIGRERIVTTVSGLYGYNDTSRLRASVYDEQGRLASTKEATATVNGTTFLPLELAPDQLAIVERNN